MNQESLTDQWLLVEQVYSVVRLEEIAEAINDWIDNVLAKPKKQNAHLKLGAPVAVIFSQWADSGQGVGPPPQHMYLLYSATRDERFILTADERRQFEQMARSDPRYQIPAGMPQLNDLLTWPPNTGGPDLTNPELIAQPPLSRPAQICAAVKQAAGQIQITDLAGLLNLPEQTVESWIDNEELTEMTIDIMKKLHDLTGNPVFEIQDNDSELIIRRKKSTAEQPERSGKPNLYFASAYSQERAAEIVRGVVDFIQTLPKPRQTTCPQVIGIQYPTIGAWVEARYSPGAESMSRLWFATRNPVFILTMDELDFYGKIKQLKNIPGEYLELVARFHEQADYRLELEQAYRESVQKCKLIHKPEDVILPERQKRICLVMKQLYDGFPRPKDRSVPRYMGIQQRIFLRWCNSWKDEKKIIPRPVYLQRLWKLAQKFAMAESSVFLLTALEQQGFRHLNIEIPADFPTVEEYLSGSWESQTIEISDCLPVNESPEVVEVEPELSCQELPDKIGLEPCADEPRIETVVAPAAEPPPEPAAAEIIPEDQTELLLAPDPAPSQSAGHELAAMLSAINNDYQEFKQLNQLLVGKMDLILSRFDNQNADGQQPRSAGFLPVARPEAVIHNLLVSMINLALTMKAIAQPLDQIPEHLRKMAVELVQKMVEACRLTETDFIVDEYEPETDPRVIAQVLGGLVGKNTANRQSRRP